MGVFGGAIDYRLLRPLTHDRNRATEAELEALAANPTYTLKEAIAYIDRARKIWYENRLPIDPNLRYLDAGCGIGRAALGLAARGATDVTGIDILPRHIDEASNLAARFDLPNSPEFLVADMVTWKPERRFDVVLALGVMEHVYDPRTFLKSLHDLLAPTGRAFVEHAPFLSPIGDHNAPFFRLQLPWRGALFSEQALLRLRTEQYRPSDPVTRYQDLAGGLNLMRFDDYLRYVDEAGLEFEYHNLNPQLREHRKFRYIAGLTKPLVKIPRLRDYFIITAFGILRPASGL